MNEDINGSEKLVQLKVKKSHLKLKVFGVLILFLILIATLTVGWLGFVPVLSDLMGANTPRDLGIKYTMADYEGYKTKAKASFLDLEDAPVKPNNFGDRILFDDPVKTKRLELTQEEITATVNEIGWVWMPISNAQVKIGDNIIEVSGNLNLKYMNEFIDFIGGVGYNKEDVAKAVSWAQKFASSPPIYLKANASVLNDKLSLDLVDIKIGRFSAPIDIAEKVLSTGTSNAINKVDNLEAESATLEGDGALNFKGIYPSTVYVRR